MKFFLMRKKYLKYIKNMRNLKKNIYNKIIYQITLNYFKIMK